MTNPILLAINSCQNFIIIQELISMTILHNKQFYDKVFNDFDRDQKGYIDNYDMEDILQRFYYCSEYHPSKEDIHNYAQRFTGDCDGKVCFDEFYHRMKEIQNRLYIMEKYKENQAQKNKLVEDTKDIKQQDTYNQKCKKTSMMYGPMKCTADTMNYMESFDTQQYNDKTNCNRSQLNFQGKQQCQIQLNKNCEERQIFFG